MPSTRDTRQSLVVVIGVGLRRFGVVMIRVRMMRMGKVGMMTGLFVVTGAVMLGGFMMMLGSFFMVTGGVAVMFGGFLGV